MKTIEQITDEIHALNKWYRKHDILKEWAESIVNECAQTADVEEKIGWYGDGETYEYQTINTDKIINVMKQL
jgi:hypothetical protein